jgi:hypothetical protein
MHFKKYHANGGVIDARGAVAVKGHLVRMLKAPSACEAKLPVFRLFRLFPNDYKEERPLYAEVRSCLSGLDAASSISVLDENEAIALIREVWPRALAGERLPMLDAIARCSVTVEQLEANLAFLPADQRARYVLLVKLRRARQELAAEFAEAQRRLVDDCHGRCLDLYGEGGSMCRSLCDGAMCGACGELGRQCHQSCGPIQ